MESNLVMKKVYMYWDSNNVEWISQPKRDAKFIHKLQHIFYDINLFNQTTWAGVYPLVAQRSTISAIRAVPSPAAVNSRTIW